MLLALPLLAAGCSGGDRRLDERLTDLGPGVDADGDGGTDGDGARDGDLNVTQRDDVDHDVTFDPFFELDVESFGELHFYESDDRDIIDFPIFWFERRRAVELTQRCGSNEYRELALDECRYLAHSFGPHWNCAADCRICGYSEDCNSNQCYAGDPTLMMEAGELQISGGEELVTCAENEAGTFHYECEDLTHRVFEQGDELRITAPGGSYPAFELTAEVLPRLRVNTDTSAWTRATFDGSRDVLLEWEPGGPGTFIDFVISASANEELLICRARDDGAFDFPAQRIAELTVPSTGLLNLGMERVSQRVIRPTEDSVFRARMYSPPFHAHVEVGP